jgi:hypothetical protein
LVTLFGYPTDFPVVGHRRTAAATWELAVGTWMVAKGLEQNG